MNCLLVAARPSLFFMHIPKTAGMSVRMFLDNQYASHHVLAATNWPQAVALAAGGPRDVRLARGHFPFNFRTALPNFQTLTLLREPLARTISALRHLNRDPAFHALHGIARGLTLPEMLRNETIMGCQANVQTAYLSARASPNDVAALLRANPQRDPADLEDPPDLARALDALAQIEFVGVFEALPDCIAELSQALSFHVDSGTFPHLNAAPTQELALGAQELAILRHYNELDIALYEQAGRIIASQKFVRMMRQMVRNGVYNIPHGAFTIDLAGVVPGAGWYPPERDGGAVWRWTGPGPVFTLDLVLRPELGYAVRLDLLAYHASDPIRVEVNGAAVPAKFVAGLDGGYALHFEIPQTLSCMNDGICRIIFHAAATAVMGDERPLGAAVSGITFDLTEYAASADCHIMAIA